MNLNFLISKLSFVFLLHFLVTTALFCQNPKDFMVAEKAIVREFKLLVESIQREDIKRIFATASDEFKEHIPMDLFIRSVDIEDLSGMSFELEGYTPIFYPSGSENKQDMLRCFIIFREFYPGKADERVPLKEACFWKYMVWDYNYELKQWHFVTFPFAFSYLPERVKFYGFSDIPDIPFPESSSSLFEGMP